MKQTALRLTLLCTVLASMGCAHLTVGRNTGVIDLVDTTCTALEQDVPATFADIMAGKHPYVNEDNPALYAFVYDTDVNIVAHPKTQLVGKNYRGKPDVAGNNFRDKIVDGAVKNGTGWVRYMYSKPGQAGQHKKATYYKLTKGSDGKQYVVCSGTYRD